MTALSYMTPVMWLPDAEAPLPDAPAALAHQGVTSLPNILPPPEAERPYLTVLCCVLVDSTIRAEHLDPEEFREVVRAYHQACAEMLHRFDGYIAQYRGDGVLAYFGYPVAYEDSAQRAVRAGLGLLDALDPLNTRLALPPGERVAVRLGVHTGMVVVGDVGMGRARRRWRCALPPPRVPGPQARRHGAPGRVGGRGKLRVGCQAY